MDESEWPGPRRGQQTQHGGAREDEAEGHEPTRHQPPRRVLRVHAQRRSKRPGITPQNSCYHPPQSKALIYYYYLFFQTTRARAVQTTKQHVPVRFTRPNNTYAQRPTPATAASWYGRGSISAGHATRLGTTLHANRNAVISAQGSDRMNPPPTKRHCVQSSHVQRIQCFMMYSSDLEGMSSRHCTHVF